VFLPAALYATVTAPSCAMASGQRVRLDFVADATWAGTITSGGDTLKFEFSACPPNTPGVCDCNNFTLTITCNDDVEQSVTLAAESVPQESCDCVQPVTDIYFPAAGGSVSSDCCDELANISVTVTE
jgi:hypothetical protein